jgi:mitogen-activated protein kinase kinase 3
LICRAPPRNLDQRTTMILGGKEYTVDATDLERLCELGRGAYGTVEKRRHIQSGTVLAVKVCALH